VTVIADPSAGTKGGGKASLAAGSGSGTDLHTGDALADAASGGNATHRGAEGSGTGSGGRYGKGQGTGLNSDASGTGTGYGTTAGAGLGTGSIPGTGTGSGAGSAPGKGGFPGITIQGGRYGNTSDLQATGPKTPKSYNMTIVSTGSSGGGLPDLGVFQNEKVYTVYLDMRANDEDPAPSWTLQYSVLQPPAKADGTVNRIEGTPTPPYAMLKEAPQLTPDLARKVARRMIVASAIMDPDGKLEQVSVRQTPELDLTDPIVDALKRWIFQPAEIDGHPIALKVLFGIRLAVSR
jgi:hypothetical protein